MIITYGGIQIKKEILVFTPVNPLRPHVDRLRKIHRYNVLSQNDQSLFTYIEEECVLPSALQKQGIYRGQNVIREFNNVYQANKHDYDYICKWDDDIILPSNILEFTRDKIVSGHAVGCGLFQEDYGAPTILMVNKRKEGFYGAFSRFYMYRMDKWGKVPCEMGGPRGDPDNAYQVRIQGKKLILECWSLHLDHRAIPLNKDQPYQDRYSLYRVMLDWIGFVLPHLRFEQV